MKKPYQRPELRELSPAGYAVRAFPRTTDASARVAVNLCRVEDLEVRDVLTVEIRALVEAVALEVHAQATLPPERIAALLGSIFGVRK